MALLEVDDLRVSFATQDGIVSAVRGVSFTVAEGQTLGIVGESGSGKSVATQTIVGLTRGAQVSGSARFEGRDLLAASPAELRSVRGALDERAGDDDLRDGIVRVRRGLGSFLRKRTLRCHNTGRQSTGYRGCHRPVAA